MRILSAPIVSIRTTGDPLAIVPFLREAVADVTPRARLDDGRTAVRVVAQPRFYSVFVGLFAAVSLFLATFGIYGMLAYTVAQRRLEIGVRMALGAERRDIVALVVRQGVVLVCVGIGLGLISAIASTELLESLLFEVTATDTVTFALGPAVLLVAALLACYLPARRATRIDPMVALRHE